MSPNFKKNALAALGYSAFFLFALAALLYLTFPFRVVADVLVAEANKAGVKLSIGSMSPSFGWLKARNIAVTPPRQEGAPEPQAIPVDEVKVRPTLFPPGVAWEAKLFGGTVTGSYGLLTKRPRLVVKAGGLDLARTNSKAAVGLDLVGKLNTAIDLQLDPDGTKIAGKIAFNGESVVINGGTVAQYDLPKVDLGRVELVVKLENGKGLVDYFKSQGADVESTLDGDVQLNQKVLLSALKLKLHFKPSEDFLKRNSFIQTGLTMAMGRDPKGFYTVNINRVLGNPGFQPQK